MFSLSFERAHRVLKVALVDVLSSDDIAAADAAVVGFTSREGPTRRLVDFTRLQAIAVSSSRLSRRGRQSPTSPGWQRVFLAPRADLLGWVRDFSDQQTLAGIHPPYIATSLREAYRVLKLVNPRFEPVDGSVFKGDRGQDF
jgi:hypothetical protein